MTVGIWGTGLVRSVLDWPVRSQQGARRNAMIASTALAARRRERLEAEEFVAEHEAARAAGSTYGDLPRAEVRRLEHPPDADDRTPPLLARIL